MNKILLYFTCIIFSMLSVSCLEKENYDFPGEAKTVEVTDSQSALKNFTIALSKIVCSNESVREFLKTEALKRIDNDYDVFYPYIKNQQLSGTLTFRDLLINEFGGESFIDKIEKTVPTLTIYVTDVTWLDADGFCAENWDTALPQIAVTYVGHDGVCHELYSNGYYLGKIEPGTVPGGPVLIVKENERIKVSAATKSGDVSYSFINDIFDGTKRKIEQKSSEHSGKYTLSWVAGQDPEDNSDIMSAEMLNALNPDIIKAFDYFKNDPYALQNDYIYYGMTPSSPTGRLRNDVRSKIVRFKISPRSFNVLFDDTASLKGDCNFVNSFETTDGGKGYSAAPSVSTIYSKLWSEGALEIHIKIIVGDGNGSQGTYEDFYYDVKAKDLFTLQSKSIKKEQWGSTMFKWHITWRYTIVGRNENTLVSKWYYPDKTPDLPIWDLVLNSAYSLIASEQDVGKTTSKTFTTITKKALSTTGKLGGEGSYKDFSIKGEFGWTGSDEQAVTKSTTFSWTETNDEMLNMPINYRDKYIDSQISSAEYKVKSYGNDRFTFTILPYRY